jgi:hypothetical protein
MAGPVPREALDKALARERQRQFMEERTSDDALLDEEGIALRDLSRQRSPVSEPHLPNLHPKFQTSSSVPQTGWRKGTREELMHRERHHTLALGKLYERMGKLSIIARYAIYIIPVGILIAIPLIIGALLPKLELGVLSFFNGN